MNDEPNAKPFSLETLEADIREMTEAAPVQYAPRRVAHALLPALPSYVEADPEVSEVGRLTAETVVRDFEETAKIIDSMREELMANVRGMEAEVKNALEVCQLLQDTAQRARDQGKAAFERIQRQAKTTASVREQIVAINEQLAQA